MQVHDKGNNDNRNYNNNEKLHTFDVIIIGSGPAGYTAAIYTSRAKLKTLIITGSLPGGQLMTTSEVENYPGFSNGIFGPELMMNMRQQAERFGSIIVDDEVIEVNFKQKPFYVKTYSEEYLSKAILVCTGATPRKLGIMGEDEYGGRGVSYCATCDGWFFKDKKVVVVGGGDSAFEEALFITRYASSVTLIHRRDEFRAGAILQNRAKEHPKMNFILNTIVTEAVGTEKLTALKLKNVITNEESVFETDGLFIFIGHTPNSQMFKGKIEMSDLGYIKVNDKMETNIPGVFAAGEIADPTFRQVVTSAGMGAAAAIQATRYLEETETVHSQG